jgi:7-cyano-7-deazaguanine synthase
MPDSVVIVSGGLDSVTLLHHLIKNERRQPAVITFRYGQKHEANELDCARFNVILLACADHQIVDLRAMQTIFSSSALVDDAVPLPTIEAVTGNPQPPTYVPNRNMIFLALAAAYAESRGVSQVFYGAQQHDMYGYWDCTLDFLARVNQVYALNRGTLIHIEAPFVNYSKADILRLGLQLGVDYAHTWSCYAGGTLACGRCPTCAERLKAFAAVGVPDPLPYARA